MESRVLERLAELLARVSGVRRGERLSRHTTMKVGGPAALWAEPENEGELRTVLQAVHGVGAPLFVLGAGSNVVASEAGFEGVVLHLGAGFEGRRVEGANIVAGGAAYLPKLTHFALNNNLGNLEWACGVPGCVGGSVRGNAGARGFDGKGLAGRDCAADFLGCVAFELDGTRRVFTRPEVEFRYRGSSLNGYVVTETTFQMRPLTEAQTLEHKEAVRELLARRRASQPANAASAGCIWKNPPGTKGAGALIEQLGLKGRQIGAAQVSELHGNFVINTGGERPGREVRELVELVEREALERAGVRLEREAWFLG